MVLIAPSSILIFCGRCFFLYSKTSWGKKKKGEPNVRLDSRQGPTGLHCEPFISLHFSACSNPEFVRIRARFLSWDHRQRGRVRNLTLKEKHGMQVTEWTFQWGECCSAVPKPCPVWASGTLSLMILQASYTGVDGSNCIVFTTLHWRTQIFSDKATILVGRVMSSPPYKPGKCKCSGISKVSALVKWRSWLNPKEIKVKKKPKNDRCKWLLQYCRICTNLQACIWVHVCVNVPDTECDYQQRWHILLCHQNQIKTHQSTRQVQGNCPVDRREPSRTDQRGTSGSPTPPGQPTSRLPRVSSADEG